MVHASGPFAPGRRRNAVLLVALLIAPLLLFIQGIAAPAAAAQEAPRQVCVAGETAGDRIDAIIGVLVGQFTLSSILASGLTVDQGNGSASLYELCPGVAVLSEFDKSYLSPLLGLLSADIWEHALKGESLAEIAQTQGVERDSLIEALQTGYSNALDKAVAAGEITDAQRQRIADHILPQFGWMVDWSHGDELPVAASEIDGGAMPAAVAGFLPGTTGGERSENVIRLIAGLPVGGTSETPVTMETAGIWTALGAALVAVIVPDGGLTPEEFYAEYLSGKSLDEIHAAHGGDPATLTDTLTDAIRQALDAEVAAGNLTVVEREQLEALLLSTIQGAIKHHLGDPLPNDLSGGSGDELLAAAAAAAPTCQGVPATIVAVGAGPIVSGPFGDVIVGTNGNDTIDGGGGVDLICGLDGNDTIEGGQGSDTIWADAGADLVYGEGSGVVVTGGHDTIHAGSGNDHILGQVGDDDLFGDNGNDELEGGDGGDELFGGNGNDDLDGGSGNDTCTGGAGTDTFSQC